MAEIGHTQLRVAVKRIVTQKNLNKSQKKSARFSKLKKEEILPVKISNQQITIHIIPISQEDQEKKRVRGYKYLTV